MKRQIVVLKRRSGYPRKSSFLPDFVIYKLWIYSFGKSQDNA